MIQALQSRMAGAEQDIRTLDSNVNALMDELKRNSNDDRTRELLNRRQQLASFISRVTLVAQMSVEERRVFVNDVLLLANRFLPDNPTDEDLWYWNSIHVATDPANPDPERRIQVRALERSFSLEPTLETYLQTIVLLAAVIEATSVQIEDLAKQRHIAFLTVNATPQQTASWPTSLQERQQPVICWSYTAPHPDERGMCYGHVTCKGATIVKIDHEARNLVESSRCNGIWPMDEAHIGQIEAELANGARGLTGEAMTAVAGLLDQAGKGPYPSFPTRSAYARNFLFAVRSSGELLQFEHIIYRDRHSEESATRRCAALRRVSPNAPCNFPTSGEFYIHELSKPVILGSGWDRFDTVHMAASTRNRILNGVEANGDLVSVRIDNFADADPNTFPLVTGHKHVGNGWNGLRHLFSSSEGVLYGVNERSQLVWHRQLDADVIEMRPDWAPANPVGTGWNGFRHLFSTGQGIIYAVNDDGDLVWYRHKSYLSGEGLTEGSQHWEPTEKVVGRGWQSFSTLVSAGNGHIYAIDIDGNLVFYDHRGFLEGNWDWVDPPVHLAAGWNGFDYVFAVIPPPYRGPS